VVCTAIAGINTCVEDSGVAADTGAVTYVLYQHDQQGAPIYSSGIALAAPAKPTTAGSFVMQSNGGVALRAPGIRRGTATVPGLAVLPMQNRGIFFLRTDTGNAERRAELLNSTVQRRPSIFTLSTGEQRVFVAESNSAANYVRMDPAGVEASSSFLVNQSVYASVTSVQANLLGPINGSATATLNSVYTTDVMLVGTNNANNNTVRALKPIPSDPSAQYWSYLLPTGTDAVRADAYVDYERAWALVPIAAGGGGIMGFDLSTVAGGAVPPPQPAAWSTRRILSGVFIQSQPRKLLGKYVVGSYTNPGVIYAIDPTTATSGGTTSFTLTGEGQVRQVLPSGSNGIVYATQDGNVGRLLLTASPLGLARDTGFTTWVSPVGTLGGITSTVGFFYVSSGNRIYKLNATTGAEVASVEVDTGATAISEVALEGWGGTLVVGTDTGAVFGIPLF
jgi:hypothetical protein